jgi:phosphomannomutase
MRIDPGIFHAYDIRAIVPDELDAAGAEHIARGFAAYLKPKTVVVGRDVRLTGPEFREAVIEGLTKSGVDVIDIGVVSTDEFYFACGDRQFPGIMITASHNPPEYNGFKMIKQMPFFVLAKEFKPKVIGKKFKDTPKPGAATTEDVSAAFLDRMLELVKPNTLKPLSVVIDASNGSQGAAWKALAKRLPIKATPLFWEADGNFPNHGNDVIQPENQAPLRAKVKEIGADLGLIFDPDGDRCLVVDDRGQTVPGDFLTALLAETMLKRAPGSTIVYDVRASDAVPETIRAAGGKPFPWKIGHAFIKPKMQEHDAVFGGEVSGHFYFKDFWFADCGLLAGLTVLEYVSQLDGKLSDKLQELETRYFLSGEVNSTVKDQAAALKRIKETYADGEIDELDGVAVRYPDWHFVVRPSNNEPLIRLTLEAKSQRQMEQKRDEVLKLIRS